MSKCADEDRVMYVVNMLKVDALFWWDAESGMHGSRAAKGMTWGKFVEIFKKKFFSKTIVKQLEEEFLRLEKGTMRVQDYIAKFLEKSRFAEIYVSTEERQVDRYI